MHQVLRTLARGCVERRTGRAVMDQSDRSQAGKFDRVLERDSLLVAVPTRDRDDGVLDLVVSVGARRRARLLRHLAGERQLQREQLLVPRPVGSRVVRVQALKQPCSCIVVLALVLALAAAAAAAGEQLDASKRVLGRSRSLLKTMSDTSPHPKRARTSDSACAASFARPSLKPTALGVLRFESLLSKTSKPAPGSSRQALNECVP